MLKNKIALAATLVVVASFISREAEAQSVASRVAAVGNGKVRMTFAYAVEICGYGNSISRGGSNRMSWTSDQSADVVYDDECSHSPVRLALLAETRRVTKL